MLATDGQYLGRQIVSPASIEKFSTPQASGPDSTIGINMSWAVGYQVNAEVQPGGPTLFGLGEALSGTTEWRSDRLCDPRLKLGVGYVRSHPTYEEVLSMQLLPALYDALMSG